MGGDFCCAVGCHNHRAANKRVTFHTFPRDLPRRARWVAAVRRKHWVPTKRSRLCSEHFSEDSYELGSRLAKEFGLGQKSQKLKLDAVPTIFCYVVAPPTRHRGAFAKRRRKDLVDEAIAASTATDVASSVLDPGPDPHPVGNESPHQEWGQIPVDICGLSPEAAQGPKEVSTSVQTEGVQACTQSVQTKVKARSVGTQTTFAYQQRSVN